MTDMELAQEIERYLAPDAIYYQWMPSMADMEQIIAALRRGPELQERFDCIRYPRCSEWCGGNECPVPERPPSGEMVMVPRDRPTAAMYDAWEKSYRYYQDYHMTAYQAFVERYRAMLSAAEAEVHKPYAHVMGACPLCGRTDAHYHTSGPLGIS